ncbi:unnamed protein product [Spirodela intermedia]|uniref:Chorismate-utilising enzyme C-terminal domain-containing protein n=1 Tax=Spirodela intermedia TaxID=51605 RepID=A0A7I8JNH6_SPIIN|nr:unnamed protein product [Spirodela intermedia]CAA6671706.1 unnamed protein product [Spirodela intermedia]
MRQLTAPDTVRLSARLRRWSSAASTSPSPLFKLTRDFCGLLQNNRCRCSHPSMNGCEGQQEERHSAVSELRSAVAALAADAPEFSSGIIRLEVPIKQRSEAVAWLHAQQTLPRVFFSGRGGWEADEDAAEERRSEGGSNLVSVAGVGSAVYFRRFEPFSFEDWKCIRRFLSKDCPFIRAYGALRFDATTKISSEWKTLVEFNELEESSKLAINIAWDDNLRWPWEKAMDGLLNTMDQISPSASSLQRQVPRSTVLSSSHTPSKAYWDVCINKALQMIKGENSDLLKVVLARSSRILTSAEINPITLLACLQMEGQKAYQFCIQPAGGPAFIGNTVTISQEDLQVWSEALAGTRARGRTVRDDLKIRQDLLLSRKDDVEFSIIICDEVRVESSKTIRKLPRVQHLCARLSGRLKREEDEFYVLTHLHPTPAVCGLPTEEARRFIAENEAFDRGMYAGPVGWFGGRETEFAVGIRSALVGRGQPLRGEPDRVRSANALAGALPLYQQPKV